MYVYIKGKDNVRILVAPATEDYIGANDLVQWESIQT